MLTFIELRNRGKCGIECRNGRVAHFSGGIGRNSFEFLSGRKGEWISFLIGMNELETKRRRRTFMAG